ncbi:hypothetical protein Ciccas_013977, partial [Cichlidogyrus casuarinus]
KDDSQERQTHLPKVTRPQGKYGHNEPTKLRNSFKEPSPPTKSIPPLIKFHLNHLHLPVLQNHKPLTFRLKQKNRGNRLGCRAPLCLPDHLSATGLGPRSTRMKSRRNCRMVTPDPRNPERKRMSYHDLPVRRVNTFCLRNPITHEDRIVYRPIKKEIQVSAEDIPHRLAHKMTTCTQTKRRSASASRQTSVMADSSLSCGYGSMDEGMLMVWFAGD